MAAGAGQGRGGRHRPRLDVGGALRADRLRADDLPPPAVLVGDALANTARMPHLPKPIACLNLHDRGDSPSWDRCVCAYTINLLRLQVRHEGGVPHAAAGHGSGAGQGAAPQLCSHCRRHLWQGESEAAAPPQQLLFALSGARPHVACTSSRLPTKPWLQVVNLVSNDVRRFDDAGPFWVRTLQPCTGPALVCNAATQCPRFGGAMAPLGTARALCAHVADTAAGVPVLEPAGAVLRGADDQPGAGGGAGLRRHRGPAGPHPRPGVHTC